MFICLPVLPVVELQLPSHHHSHPHRNSRFSSQAVKVFHNKSVAKFHFWAMSFDVCEAFYDYYDIEYFSSQAT